MEYSCENNEFKIANAFTVDLLQLFTNFWHDAAFTVHYVSVDRRYTNSGLNALACLNCRPLLCVYLANQLTLKVLNF